jgi:phospholipid transport system substrate-binding protein
MTNNDEIPANGGSSNRRGASLPRRAFITGAAAAATLLHGTVHADTSGAVPAAEAYIGSLTAHGIASLTAAGISEAERSNRFRVLLIENLDVPAIGRFALGRYWQSASETERAEYLRLFEDMLVAIYAARLAEYSGERVHVTGSRTTAQGDIFVASSVVLPQQPQDQMPLEWVLRRDGAGFKIMDVRAEGVSMAITQRDEFAAVIQRGGGRVSALVGIMRAMLARR